MNKNLLFTTAINNSETSRIPNSDYSQYCIKTYESWCKKNNVDWMVIDESHKRYKYPVWNKDTIFELVGDKYDKIGYVDSDTMIKWDAPNIFDLYDDEFCTVRESASLRWILGSLNNFKKFYPNIKINNREILTNYFNSGVSFFTKKHKYVFDNLIDLYEKNSVELDRVGTLGCGKVQTLLNYELINTNTKMKYLSPSWNLISIHKKEMFGYNWQLDEDKTPFFIKYAYIWHFTGFPIEDRIKIMKQTWDIIGHNYK